MFYSIKWPLQYNCYLPALRAHNFTTYQIFASVQQVAAVDFTTLSASRAGRQVRGCHDLDESKKRKEEEEALKSQETSLSQVFCLCTWMYFQFKQDDVEGTKHKETLFRSVRMPQLSQSLYTSERINPKQWETTVVCLWLFMGEHTKMHCRFMLSHSSLKVAYLKLLYSTLIHRVSQQGQEQGFLYKTSINW